MTTNYLSDSYNEKKQVQFIIQMGIIKYHHN